MASGAAYYMVSSEHKSHHVVWHRGLEGPHHQAPLHLSRGGVEAVYLVAGAHVLDWNLPDERSGREAFIHDRQSNARKPAVVLGQQHQRVNARDTVDRPRPVE